MASEDVAELYTRVVDELNLDRESLTVEDLEQVLVACGYRFTKQEIVEKFVQSDTDGDWKISLDEFLTMVERALPSGSRDSIAASVRRAFSARDLNSDGFITLKELEETMPEAGCLDKEMLQSLVKEYDEDGDGKIDFEEFVTMYIKTQILGDADSDDENPNDGENEIVQETKEFILSADDLREYCRKVEQDGLVSVADLQEKMVNLSVPLTEEQFDYCVTSVGYDEEGRIKFEEFVTVYEDVVLRLDEVDVEEARPGDEDADLNGGQNVAEDEDRQVEREKEVEISADLDVDRDELLNKPTEPEDQELDANENNVMANEPVSRASHNVTAKYPPSNGQNEGEEDSSLKTQSSQNDTYVIQDADIVKSKQKMFDGGKPVSNVKKGVNPDIISCNVECKAGGINVKAMMAKFQQK